jgi:hypothetical protein
MPPQARRRAYRGRPDAAATMAIQSNSKRACMRAVESCTYKRNSSRSSPNCRRRHRRHMASSDIATIHSDSLSGRSHSCRYGRRHSSRSCKRRRDCPRSRRDRRQRRKEDRRPGDQEVRRDEPDQRARRPREVEKGLRPEDRQDPQNRRRACREEVRQRRQEGVRRAEGRATAGPARRRRWLPPRRASRSRTDTFIVSLLMDAPLFPIPGRPRL